MVVGLRSVDITIRRYFKGFRVHCKQNVSTVLLTFKAPNDSNPINRLSLKVFDDPSTGTMWKRSVKDIEGEILCVSQFTLMAKTIKGAKPDFHKVSHPVARSSSSRTNDKRVGNGKSRPPIDCKLRLSHFQTGEASRPMYAEFLDILGRAYNHTRVKGTRLFRCLSSQTLTQYLYRWTIRSNDERIAH